VTRSRRSQATWLWVTLSVIVVGVPIVLTATFGTTRSADVRSVDELVGVWEADDPGGELRLETDRTAVLTSFVRDPLPDGTPLQGTDGRGEWSYVPGTVRIDLTGADRIEFDPVTCGFEVCLRYQPDEDAAVMFRRHAEG